MPHVAGTVESRSNGQAGESGYDEMRQMNGTKRVSQTVVMQ